MSPNTARTKVYAQAGSARLDFRRTTLGPLTFALVAAASGLWLTIAPEAADNVRPMSTTAWRVVGLAFVGFALALAGAVALRLGQMLGRVPVFYVETSASRTRVTAPVVRRGRRLLTISAGQGARVEIRPAADEDFSELALAVAGVPASTITVRAPASVAAALGKQLDKTIGSARQPNTAT